MLNLQAIFLNFDFCRWPTLSLYSTLRTLQLKMETLVSAGMFNTLVTHCLVDGSMGSAFSFRSCLVRTLLFFEAKKLCFWYKLNLGLTVREELFTMSTFTVICSPVNELSMCSLEIDNMDVNGICLTLVYSFNK